MNYPIILGLWMAINPLWSVCDPGQETLDPVGFEQAQPGQLEELSSSLGTWTSELGRAFIDDQHSKTGRQCLRLVGGEKTSVTLQVNESVDTSGVLSFWAERWTARKPFSFRIEKRTEKGWQELYNGDTKVQVGRAFLSQVRVPLGEAGITHLRFLCTSPPNTGILIDDIRIAPAQPQRIDQAEVLSFTLPALVGAPSSPLLKLKITTTGTLHPISLTGVTILRNDSAKASSPVESVFVSPQPGGTDDPSRTVVDTSDWNAGETKKIKASYELAEGENIFWVNGRLRKGSNIDQSLDTAVCQITLSSQVIRFEKPVSSKQRLGVAVRSSGEDGVHTYRIPGLVTTNQGTLIGVYDVRRRSGGDLPGDIDVGMSRSTDGGQSWEPMKIIMDMGDDAAWRYDGIGDPSILVDQRRGTIWVAATWSHGDRSWRGSGPGLDPDETGQLMLARSDDDGITWSKPINITKQVKKPEWCFLLQGPGKGITMRDGTLVFAAQYQDPPEKKRLPHSTIIYSKDHGETWRVGKGAFDDTTEAQVVETEPGILMLNCRYNRGNTRVVMITRDMGETWQEHSTSQRALIEPRACMASLIDVDREVGKGGSGWLLFSNPDSTRTRNRLSIKASPDGGVTWPKPHRILLDEHPSAGYSCLTMIDESTVGILFEGSQAHMTFQRIPLTELVPPKEETSNPQNSDHPSDGERGGQSLRLPPVFGHHMVLQAEREIPVWGRADAGAPITIRLGEEEHSTTADPQGRWGVRLKPREANPVPTTMFVRSGDQSLVLEDILIGEVWVCAGQSNMEWMLRHSNHGEEELAHADQPQLRLLSLRGGANGHHHSYTQENLARLRPELYSQGQWQVASAKTAQSFSAVGWTFGRYLQQQLKIPIGLVCTAVGGTPTEAWIAPEALEANSHLQGLVKGDWLDNPRLGEFCRTRGKQNLLAPIQAGENIPGDELGPHHPFKPGFMWEAGIKPLIPFGIRGAIWYQGESNAETPARVIEHRFLLPLLIQQWRKAWGQGKFPFLYVQLPALNRPEWPWFRDGQRRVLKEEKNVGMAITIDTGDPSDVHPRSKKPVGERLAKWALGAVYRSSSQRSYSGPLFETCQRQENSILVSFRHAGDGLVSSDGQPLRHFEIAGEDRIFREAKAEIMGRNTIALSSPGVREPLHVRYGWRPYPEPTVNLFNYAGLPASPFTSESLWESFERRIDALDHPRTAELARRFFIPWEATSQSEVEK